MKDTHPTPIVTAGAPVLRVVAPEVPKELFGTKELTGILSAMEASLRSAEFGVAIAAPQIGVSYRIFTVRGFVVAGNERNDDDPDVVFINPKIVNSSRKKISVTGEGCLSVPNVYGTIERAEKVTVVAHDASGKKFQRGGSELLAEIFQHEVDHLNGVLFIDHATDLKKTLPDGTFIDYD